MKQLLLIVVTLFSGVFCAQEKVLVFSKTDGFRHKSIEIGVKTIENLGKSNHFEVHHTEDATLFNTKNLTQYQLVVFLNTTKNVFNENEQTAFKTYINNGGSFLGVHAATDTEFDWPWYNQLVGAYFLDHPEKCNATINVVNTTHPSTKHLKSTWSVYDEWYNFKNISDAITVVLTLDESSYKGGKNGGFHPIAWYQEFDGGRMFYTGLGHTSEMYGNADFQQHLLGGIFYCLNR
ncbi:Crp/Fnr family transcriptional regulator [Tamlana nanhaiensis]|uniref:Crp/Fnr family transcriptional regulator n=1 Tax=Neotamlana nanhaiensis TaxID=1382798 RepID=A0A0D7VWP2_9FLAO|nr:ThuA domain-containing protein [Tamlana nanhaiensis]KJD31280.1 Crp/Fnr family transcriptional regulator [Tamlana nanhaiensis]